MIVSSNFSRAVQTATIFRESLKETLNKEIEIHVTDLLRERYFGSWEGKSNSHYDDIWKEDSKLGGDHHTFGVESTNEVLDRCKKLLDDLEKKHSNCTIFLVSHGDCLQILQTYFKGVSSSLHREMPHMHNCEIRELHF